MIWDFQDALTRRLLLWSALSMFAGAALLLFGDAFWRGFGLQALVWGVIDAGIAIFGRRSANKLSQAGESRPTLHRRAGRPESAPAAVDQHRARRAVRGRWSHFAIDSGPGSAFAHGNGWGIIVQGAFLFLFDLFHALTVPGGSRLCPHSMRLPGRSTGRSRWRPGNRQPCFCTGFSARRPRCAGWPRR